MICMAKSNRFPCQGCGACEYCAERAVQQLILPPCTHAAARRAGAVVRPVCPPTVLCRNEADMSRYCAELMRACVAEKPDALFCLAAGKTAVGTYREFVRMVHDGEVDASRARFVSLDEWVGLSEAALQEDCLHFMMENVYGPLNVSPERLTLFNSSAPDLDAECRRIDQAISAAGGVDFMLLGLGMNGHLGLNEPGADFHSLSHVTTLSDVTKQVGQKYFSAPTDLTGGITTGILHMFRAKQVILQVCGSHKRNIVRRLYTEELSEQLPATVFQVFPHGLVVLDEEAAADIRMLI